MPECRRALLVLCGAICFAVAGPASGAGNSFDGDYAGTRSLTKGPSPPCPAKENVSVTISDGTLTFTDSAFRKFVMGFDPEPDGSFGSTYVDSAGATVDIRGRITGTSIEADVVNAPCEHHWHLEKKPPAQ